MPNKATALAINLLVGMTAAEWTSNNPTLLQYEIGVESDTGLMKRGNASTAWTSLNYMNPQSVASEGDVVTVATTSNTDVYFTAPIAGILQSALTTPLVALAASDSNYITHTLTNLGQAGAGTAAMLAATDANTTKSTGGSAYSINTVRTLTLSSTSADLVVAKGDRLRLRMAATGTLANTVTGFKSLLSFISG